MSDGAPVCPITLPQTPASQPTIQLPSIPHAVDLPSAIQAIHALTRAFQTLIRSPWKVSNINKELVKIVNPDDETIFIIVERIINVTVTNPVTGQTMTIP